MEPSSLLPSTSVTSTPDAAPNTTLSAARFSPMLILQLCLRKWYWIVLSALVGAAIAYYIAAKQGYVYEAKARVMMREQKRQDTASELMLRKLGIGNDLASIGNETFIMKSSGVMLRVVEDLKLNVSYWVKEDIRLLDIYKDSPVTVEFKTVEETDAASVTITVIDDSQFVLAYKDTEHKSIEQMESFDKSITLPFGSIFVRLTNPSSEYCNSPIIVNKSSIGATAVTLLNNFKVMRPDVDQASLLNLSLQTSNPKKAVDTINHLIQVYNQTSKNERDNAASKASYFIKKKLRELHDELNSLGDEITRIKHNNEIANNVTASISREYDNAQALDEKIFALKTNIKLINQFIYNLQEDQGKPGMITLDTAITDQSIREQIRDYNENFLAYQQIGDSAGRNNPILINLLTRMSTAKAAAIKMALNYKLNLLTQLDDWEQKHKKYLDRIGALGPKDQEIIPLEREYKTKEGLFVTFFEKDSENALALAISEDPVTVLEYALTSKKPIKPDITQFVSIGAGGGAILCLAILTMSVILDKKVKSKHDLETITTIPVIGDIPSLSKREQKQIDLIIEDDRSIIAECYQIIRNNIESFIPDTNYTGGLVILLTSTTSGEGKTMTSANIAAAFGKVGKKVLLIDGDLRKGSLTKRLNGQGRKGLTTLLLHGDDPSTVIQPVEGTPNLDVLFRGPAAPNPVALLSSPEVGLIFQAIKKTYDAIIIDTAPYGILADTALLSTYADITLYTIRSGIIDKRHIEKVEQLNNQGKLPNMAFLVNDVDFKTASYNYYGYGYGYYYGYGNYGDNH